MSGRSSVGTRAISGLLFPLHEVLKGHSTTRLRRFLERSQWWDPAQLAEHCGLRLRRLVGHAYERTPYYRELFDRHGIAATDIRTAADLARVPLLTKALIRQAPERLRAPGAHRLKRRTTSGSSGEPLTFYLGPERISHDVAAKWRATRWWGVDIGDSEIVVWGSPIELGAQDRVRSLRDRVMRSRMLSAFELSPENIAEHIRIIRKLRPRMLYGYPSALAHVARCAERSGESLSDLGIAVAFVTGERLYDVQRDIISHVFGCPVANGYGARDAGFVAHECPLGAMHVTGEDIIVELLDGDGRPVAGGSPGEVVVTHTASFGYPLIRYRTGDIAVMSPEPCRCGRGLPVLSEVHGRTTDFVVASDGTVMHGLALIYILREVAGIEAFRIEQKSRTLTEIDIVPSERFDRDTTCHIIREFKRRLGSDVDVAIELVHQIASDKSGKFRFVVSQATADLVANRTG
jgi:phenylacetate-CoA ligase